VLFFVEKKLILNCEKVIIKIILRKHVVKKKFLLIFLLFLEIFSIKLKDRMDKNNEINSNINFFSLEKFSKKILPNANKG
jgi:hypothetical protein